MWKITKDFINITEEKVTGKKTKDFVEGMAKYKFRLKDDDSNVYYHGVCDTNDDDNAFEPLDYYQGHSGCTTIEYKNEENGHWEVL